MFMRVVVVHSTSQPQGEPAVVDVLHKSLARCLAKYSPSHTSNPETLRIFVLVLEDPSLVRVPLPPLQ